MPHHNATQHSFTPTDSITPRTIAELATQLRIHDDRPLRRVWARVFRDDAVLTPRCIADLLHRTREVCARESLTTPLLQQVRKTMIRVVEHVSPILLIAESGRCWAEHLGICTQIATALSHESIQDGISNSRPQPFPIKALERIAGQPGYLTVLPSTGNWLEGFSLRGDTDFAQLLFFARHAARLTQSGLAARYAAWGLKQVAVSSWERGASLPNHAQGGLVLLIAHELQVHELFQAYREARAARERDHPRAKSRDVDFTSFVLPHRETIDRLLATPDRNQACNPFTRKGLTRAISYVLAAASLPVDAPARRRGLGWNMRECDLLTILDPEVIAAAAELLCARGGFSREAIASRNQVFSTLSAFVRPHGPIWNLPAELTHRNPPSASRLTLVWPENLPVDSKGARCNSLDEQVRAQCYIAHPQYRSLATASYPSYLSRNTRTRLQRALTQHPKLLVALFRLLRSLDLRGSLMTDDKRAAAMVASLIIATILRPLGCGDDEWQRWRIESSSPGRYQLIVLGRDGTTTWQREAPSQLIRFVAPYHKLRARLGDACASYFVTPNEAEMTVSSQRYWFRRIVRLHQSKLFPSGLTLWDILPMVATDFAIRFGMRDGPKLASALCRKPVAVARAVVLLDNLTTIKGRTRSHAIERALGDALREAGSANDRVRLNEKPRRLRRSRAEIHRWRRLRSRS